MNWSYLFKNWFSTLLVAPTLYDIINYHAGTRTIFAFTSILPVTLILGFLFSFPTYVVYGIIYNLLAKKDIQQHYSKIILISITVIGIVITFDSTFGTNDKNLPLAYSLTSIFFGIIYKLNFKESDKNQSI